jgi:ADP-ribose pyrophosphatase YjhB (NUDIX family)
MSERDKASLEWFRWASRIRAIAQTGLAYAKDPYDLDRYTELNKIAIECLARVAAQPVPDVSDQFAGETGYPTPKVDVRAVVFHESRVLLVRERLDGKWSLPGGWADVGHSPGEVAAKEVLEESGYVVRPRKVLAVFDKAKHDHPLSLHYAYKLFIQCDLEGGAPATSVETDAVGFFGKDEIPPLSPGRVTPIQLARMFGHLEQPDLPTDFD